MAITKANIREFLTAKRQEVYDTKIKPLEKEKDALKDQTLRAAIAEIQNKSTWDLEKFAEKYVELCKEAAMIRDDAGVFWGIPRDLGSDADNTKEEIVDRLIYQFKCGNAEITYPIRVNEIDTEIQDLQIRLRDQFRKLEALVLANSAKQCITLLREAGFDMDDLENRFATPKNEVKALDIDNDLLDLPEQKKAANNG